MKSSTVIITRGYALVNWKKREIDLLFPETPLGMKHLAEAISFESGMSLDEVEYYLYDRRDFDILNEELCKSGCLFEIVPVWFDPELLVVRR